jgi:hypothetical protein
MYIPRRFTATFHKWIYTQFSRQVQIQDDADFLL